MQWLQLIEVLELEIILYDLFQLKKFIKVNILLPVADRLEARRNTLAMTMASRGFFVTACIRSRKKL